MKGLISPPAPFPLKLTEDPSFVWAHDHGPMSKPGVMKVILYHVHTIITVVEIRVITCNSGNHGGAASTKKTNHL